jgi:hypothetical protein
LLLEVTKMEEGQTKKIRLGAGFRPPFSGFHNLDLNMVLFPWQDDSKQTSYAPDQLDFFSSRLLIISIMFVVVSAITVVLFCFIPTWRFLYLCPPGGLQPMLGPAEQ